MSFKVHTPEKIRWSEGLAMKHPSWSWTITIALTTTGTLAFILYSLTLGISTVVNHLLYIPIIITSYAFPRKGTYFSIIVASIYLTMVYLYAGVNLSVLYAATARFYLFVLVGIVVSYLSLRIRAEEEKYRLISNYSADGILIADPGSFAIHTSNQRGIEIFSTFEPKSEPVTLFDLIEPDDWSLIRSATAHLTPLSHIRSESVEVRAGTKIQPELTLTLTFSCIQDEIEEREYLMIMVEDITSRKQARSLREQQAAALSASMDGIAIVEDNQTFFYANESFLRIFGYDESCSLEGKHWWTLISHEEAGRLRDTIIPALGIGSGWRGESVGVQCNGTKIPVEISFSLIRSGGMIMVIRDISEVRRAARALKRINQKLNLLSAITRHSIRDQIYIILGYIHMSMEQVNDLHIQGYLEKQHHAACAISSQIEFAKNYQDLGLHPPSWQNVKEVFLFAISHLDMGEITRHISADGIMLYADPMLEKAFFYIAEYFCTPDRNTTCITVSARESGEGLILVFEDDGSAVHPDEKERLFEYHEGSMMNSGLFLAQEILSITGILISETGIGPCTTRFEVMAPPGGYRTVQPSASEQSK